MKKILHWELLKPFIPMGKVLVIEDERNMRMFLDILLREEGYDVLLADNGWVGLERYRRDHPDVILLDLNMPVLDGVTVLKEIRRVDLKQPVIIMTGDTNPETERQVRALGVSEFIVKGVSLQALTDVLKRLLETPVPKISSSSDIETPASLSESEPTTERPSI
jgi:DNA-binding response OmpR family regulator